jgi:hypothetical protein
MNDPYSTPPQSPREQKCPDAPKKKDKKSAKEENCECCDNLICNECLDDFYDNGNSSRSLF